MFIMAIPMIYPMDNNKKYTSDYQPGGKKKEKKEKEESGEKTHNFDHYLNQF